MKNKTISKKMGLIKRTLLLWVTNMILVSGFFAQNLDVFVELGGIGHDFVLDETNQILYVSVPSFNEVVAISTSDFQIVDRFFVGSSPRGIDLAEDGTRLFVALNEASAVAVLDLVSGEVQEIVVGVELGSSQPWDIVEAGVDRLFVTSNSVNGGFTTIIEIRLDQENAVKTVANNQFSSGARSLTVSPDQHFLYIGGGGFSSNSISKLDLFDIEAPIVLENGSSSVSGTGVLTVSPDGTRIHTTSGQVLRTGSFIQAGKVAPGIADYNAQEGVFFVAKSNSSSFEDEPTTTVASFNRTTLLEEESWTLNCLNKGSGGFSRFMALPESGGFLLLSDDTICGLVGGLAGLDEDGDSVVDTTDNCLSISNTDQLDTDADGLGDVCDPFPNDLDNLDACLVELATSDSTTLLQEIENLKTELSVLSAENQTLAQNNSGLSSLNESLSSEVAILTARNRELEELVDTGEGTPMDSDNDGVSDNTDECPDTRVLTTSIVDAKGCTPFQSWVNRLLADPSL